MPLPCCGWFAVVFPKLKLEQMLKWANGMPRSFSLSGHKHSFWRADTEESYSREGHMCPVVDTQDWAGSFHIEGLWTENPWVEAMVQDTSQVAWLDPAPAPCCPLDPDSSPHPVSRVASLHFQEITGIKSKWSSLRADRNSAPFHFSFWIVRSFCFAL